MRIIFMGTPEFALPALEKLVENQHEVSAVVTQPDKPAGRGRATVPPPTKVWASSHTIPVLQPRSLKDMGIQQKLRSLRPEAIVVAAFGQLLPKSVLDIPPLGCINIHPSLLPKFRGPSPVAGAILAGEHITGVTIMLMDEGWDTGPILAQRPVPITPDDTTGTLEKRLAELGAELLVDTLPKLAAGEIRPKPQDHAKAIYTKPIKKDDGLIDWRAPAEELSLRCRAFNPWPTCFTSLKGKVLKILRAHPHSEWSAEEAPGRVIEADIPEERRPPKAIGVITGQGLLHLEEVQMEGGKAMPVEQFARGQRDFVGSILG